MLVCVPTDFDSLSILPVISAKECARMGGFAFYYEGDIVGITLVESVIIHAKIISCCTADSEYNDSNND